MVVFLIFVLFMLFFCRDDHNLRDLTDSIILSLIGTSCVLVLYQWAIEIWSML